MIGGLILISFLALSNLVHFPEIVILDVGKWLHFTFFNNPQSVVSSC